MNIKQAEELTGVSRQNIRFYEREGLLAPRRDPDNDYRHYSEEDIHTLKLVRALRMLDMPLPQIKEVLRGDISLSQAAAQQQERLEAQSKELEAAIHLCQEFSALPGVEALDIDTLLNRMDTPAKSGGFFRDWLNDYRKVALSEHEKRFTFVPDEAVTTPREFTDALFQYARKNDLDLVMLHESMCPTFTIDGIEYTATRNYGRSFRVPVATIHCQVLHPEDFEPTQVPPARRRVQKLLHDLWLPVLLCVLILLPRLDLLRSWEGWVILISLFAAVGAVSVRSWLLFYNENGKKGKKKD
ncbi:MAG: MerR family transcriptional regulator [Oscillospiraceae bacterium]|nr:MerR family transcriptional regulator [Oscillospiraceae bacterium]